jgi:hypothetical protein
MIMRDVVHNHDRLRHRATACSARAITQDSAIDARSLL